jgi:hypothetical protein
LLLPHQRMTAAGTAEPWRPWMERIAADSLCTSNAGSL